MTIQKDDFARFLSDAQIMLAGASDTGIKQTLYNVLDEFCEYSMAWRETLTVPVLAGTTQGNINTNTQYQLTPAEGGNIIGLIGVWDPNNIPQPAFLPTFDGGPNAIGLLTLVNPVNQNQNFTVVVWKNVMLPTSRENVPEFSATLFRRYRRIILDGVCGSMQGQPNKPYSNDTKAQANLIRFHAGVSVARRQADAQNTRGAQAWAFPQSFRTGGQRGGVSTANPQSF